MPATNTDTAPEARPVPRLKERYRAEIAGAMR